MPLARNLSGQLLMGRVNLAELVRAVDTPAYVYDVDAMAAEARALRGSFGGASHLVAYAVKANSAGRIVRALGAEGCGADVVSGGELLLALECGIAPERILYSGVAKMDGELDCAIGTGPAGIGAIAIESVEEIARVEGRARAAGRKARVSLRLNPGVDLKGVTHAHIATGHDEAKFGVHRDDVAEAVRLIEHSTWLDLVGMATHPGSQFLMTPPYVDAAKVLFSLVRGMRAEGHLGALAFVDTGGGFGVDYDAPVPSEGAPIDPKAHAERARPSDFISAVVREQRTFGLGDLALYVEPGRSLVAPFGVLLARTVQVKVTPAARWLMIDAGMNDLIRPALYQARHRIVPIDCGATPIETRPWRVVGPVCESSDDFGAHELPVNPPTAVAILDAGAYGYAMASTYNGRPLPGEVFVSGCHVAALTQRAPVETWVRHRSTAGG